MRRFKEGDLVVCIRLPDGGKLSRFYTPLNKTYKVVGLIGALCIRLEGHEPLGYSESRFKLVSFNNIKVI